MNTPTDEGPLLSPIWYAIGSIFAVPIIVVLCIVTAAVVAIAWPVAPFVMYRVCKKERAQQAQPAETPPPSSN